MIGCFAWQNSLQSPERVGVEEIRDLKRKIWGDCCVFFVQQQVIKREVPEENVKVLNSQNLPQKQHLKMDGKAETSCRFCTSSSCCLPASNHP